MEGTPGLSDHAQVRPGQTQALSPKSWVTWRNNLPSWPLFGPDPTGQLASEYQLGACCVCGHGGGESESHMGELEDMVSAFIELTCG